MEQPPIQPHTPDQITEETLRAQKLKELIESIDEDVLEYKNKLTTNSFTDEAEKLAFQKKLTDKVEKAKRIKGGETIEETESSISHHYTYTNPKTNKVEHQEDIEINLQESLTFFRGLYLKTNIDLHPDFDEQVQEIWNTNFDAIQSAVEEHGFNGVLIAPANIPLPELSEKMSMENGYYDGIRSDSTVKTLANIPLVSTGTDKPRLILYHATQNIADRPELKSTIGIKAQDITLEESFSLDDYIIASRTYFEKTAKHLDEDGWTWTPRTTSGSRFVRSGWSPSNSRLPVDADVAGSSHSDLGCRVARSFY